MDWSCAENEEGDHCVTALFWVTRRENESGIGENNKSPNSGEREERHDGTLGMSHNFSQRQRILER